MLKANWRRPRPCNPCCCLGLKLRCCKVTYRPTLPPDPTGQHLGATRHLVENSRREVSQVLSTWPQQLATHKTLLIACRPVRFLRLDRRREPWNLLVEWSGKVMSLASRSRDQRNRSSSDEEPPNTVVTVLGCSSQPRRKPLKETTHSLR